MVALWPRRRGRQERGMAQTKLIANGIVVTAEGEFDGDVLIDGEKIAAVGHVATPDGTEVIDAAGCFVLPGLIDNHTRICRCRSWARCPLTTTTPARRPPRPAE